MGKPNQNDSGASGADAAERKRLDDEATQRREAADHEAAQRREALDREANDRREALDREAVEKREAAQREADEAARAKVHDEAGQVVTEDKTVTLDVNSQKGNNLERAKDADGFELPARGEFRNQVAKRDDADKDLANGDPVGTTESPDPEPVRAGGPRVEAKGGQFGKGGSFPDGARSFTR